MSLFDKIKKIVQDSDTIIRENQMEKFESILQDRIKLSADKVGTYEEYVNPENGSRVTVVYTEFGPLVKEEMSGKVFKDFNKEDIIDGRTVSYTGILKVSDGNPDHKPDFTFLNNVTVGKSYVIDTPDQGFSYHYFTYGTALTMGGDFTDYTSSENRTINQFAPIGGAYDLLINVDLVFDRYKETSVLSNDVKEMGND